MENHTKDLNLIKRQNITFLSLVFFSIVLFAVALPIAVSQHPGFVIPIILVLVINLYRILTLPPPPKYVKFSKGDIIQDHYKQESWHPKYEVVEVGKSYYRIKELLDGTYKGDYEEDLPFELQKEYTVTGKIKK